MATLHDVVRAGKARYIGASTMRAWQFAKAQHTAWAAGWTAFVSMQNRYNLLNREDEREMVPLCLDQGVGIIPYSPLARGRSPEPASAAASGTPCDPAPMTYSGPGPRTSMSLIPCVPSPSSGPCHPPRSRWRGCSPGPA